MNVTFDASLWVDSHDNHQNSQIIDTAFYFTEGGQDRIIPCIYTFPEGIVFDIITLLDEEEIHKYIEKFAAFEGDDSITDLQREIIAAKCPYQSMEVKSICCNGKKSDSFSSSGMGTAMELSQNNGTIMKEIKEAYNKFIHTDCFYCQRMCVSVDGLDFTKEPLKQITINTSEKYEKAELSLKLWADEGETAQAELIHPFTGEQHTIWITNDGLETMPMGEGQLSFFGGTAEIVPPLGEGERLLFNSSTSYTKANAGKASAASISIIGGACGPTSVFIAKKGSPVANRGGQMMLCYTKPVSLVNSNDDMVIQEANCFHINGMERIVSYGETIELNSKDLQGN